MRSPHAAATQFSDAARAVSAARILSFDTNRATDINRSTTGKGGLSLLAGLRAGDK
jgi:hypothetical protein